MKEQTKNMEKLKNQGMSGLITKLNNNPDNQQNFT